MKRHETTNQKLWQALLFGTFNVKQVIFAVQDVKWQAFRTSLLNLPLDEKHSRLTHYVTSAPVGTEQIRKVQVTNYVNALKRGGLII